MSVLSELEENNIVSSSLSTFENTMMQQSRQCRRTKGCRSHLCLLLVTLAAFNHDQFDVSAFTYPVIQRSSLTFGKVRDTRKATIGRIASAPVEIVEETGADGPQKQFDSNGKEFEVGKVVRVVSDFKAYHVGKKGFGTFDPETKEFVPAPEAGERGKKCLSVPAGLRGVVTRVYDLDDLDASQPILVKFVKDENADEGYAPPLTFLMHFDNHEVECT